jgi:hypothetical protein
MQVGSISSIPALEAAAPASATVQQSNVELGKGGSATAGEASAAHGVSTNLSSHKGSNPSEGVISPLEEALAAVYTTSVAGHDYMGTVQQTAGQYVASAADPPDPPITGVGASIQAAENNLTVVIDEMV